MELEKQAPKLTHGCHSVLLTVSTVHDIAELANAIRR